MFTWALGRKYEYHSPPTVAENTPVDPFTVSVLSCMKFPTAVDYSRQVEDAITRLVPCARRIGGGVQEAIGETISYE